MSDTTVRSSCARHIRVGLGALAAVCFFAGSVQAQVSIVHVEEDWVVDIGTPDPSEDAPQIITAMSSTQQLADVHCLFELNHRTLPGYHSGGMSLQCWSGDLNLDHGTGPKAGSLHSSGEKITYTTSMKLHDGTITFEVLNGNSSTWGNFGGQGYLKTGVATPYTQFTLYSPETSVKNSRVGFAGHQVNQFYLKEVRYYGPDGLLIKTDTTKRIVHVND